MAHLNLSLGDSYFVDEDYAAASDAFSSALSSLEEEGGPSGTEAGILRFRILSHRSAARLCLGKHDDARSDALAALALLDGSGEGGDFEPLESSYLRSGEEEAAWARAGRAEEEGARYGEAKIKFERAAALAERSGRDPSQHRERAAALAIKEDLSAAAAAPLDLSSAAPAPARKAPAVGRDATGWKARTPTMPKYQYYQSDAVMTISILETSVREEDLRVEFGVDTLTVILTKEGVDFTVICGTLYDAVVVDKCKVVRKDEKVLIKLRKKEKHEWNELFGSGAPKEEKKEAEKEDAASASEGAANENEEEPAPLVKDPSKTRPYASHRDWDAIERDLKKKEEEEKPEGDEALNKLFRDIYGKADEDTKRAMVKSFQTSGGTVLSTNWGEVSKTDYEKERQAPKGMEWKDQDGNRLPQKDND